MSGMGLPSIRVHFPNKAGTGCKACAWQLTASNSELYIHNFCPGPRVPGTGDALACENITLSMSTQHAKQRSLSTRVKGGQQDTVAFATCPSWASRVQKGLSRWQACPATEVKFAMLRQNLPRQIHAETLQTYSKSRASRHGLWPW